MDSKIDAQPDQDTGEQAGQDVEMLEQNTGKSDGPKETHDQWYTDKKKHSRGSKGHEKQEHDTDKGGNQGDLDIQPGKGFIIDGNGVAAGVSNVDGCFQKTELF